jgi:type II secretory pathway pseudopilin PulG
VHRRRGITIGEVAITTTVIGALTVAALPRFTQATQKAKESALKYELSTIRKAIDTFNADTGGWPTELSDLLGEYAPRSYFYKGKEVIWQKKTWQGPYLGYGEKGADYIPKDPVSISPFVQVRADNGRLKVFSSAKGNDMDGHAYSGY